VEKIFAMYNNHSVRKAKKPTTGTSLLNHSLGLAEAREDRKKLFLGEQKREADHLSGEILVKCCSLKCKKGRENPGPRFNVLLNPPADAACDAAVPPRPTIAGHPR
jgi:hypothetical protein